MNSRMLAALLSACVALSSAPSGRAQEPAPTSSAASSRPPASNAPDAGEVAADALIVRPVSFAATAVGAAIFVVALPFAAIARDVKGTGRALVGAPAAFTFKRKLGDFSDSRQW